MKGLAVKLVLVVSVLTCLLTAASAQAADAFAILEKLEEHYVGLQHKGLKTVIGKASISAFPDADITVYWSREKGTKVLVKGGGPAAAGAGPMVKGYLGAAGLGMKRMSEEHKLTSDKAVGKMEKTVLKGKKVTKLTFTPKEGQDLGFDKLVVVVDTKEWLPRRVEVVTEGEEAVSDLSYEGSLPSMMVSTSGDMKVTLQNTFVKKGKVKILSKQTVKMEGPEVPEPMSEISITYSDIKINKKIPEEIFAEPKAGDVPKPKASAQELMTQAQAAMQQGDMEAAKLKLRQIVTHYPDDPMATGAKLMLEQLP